MRLTTRERLRLYLIQSGVWTGCALIAVVAPMMAILLPAIDFKSPLFYVRPTATAHGYVVDSSPTSYRGSENEAAIWAYLYTFRLGSRNQLGLSYSSTLRLKKGDAVAVQYQRAQPAFSRIEGARSAPFPLWTVALIGSFMVGGCQLIGRGLQRAKRIEALAADAFVTTAICDKAFEPKGQNSDFATTYEARYVYHFNGSAYSHALETSTLQEIGSRRVLVLQRGRPSNAALSTNLPTFIWERLKLHYA